MMKQYHLFNKEYNDTTPIAALFYNTENKEFHIDIEKEIPYSYLPIYFQLKVKQAVYHLDAKDSFAFVEDRLVPANRVNIRELLNAIGIDEYDEFEILKFFSARCSQDACYMVEIK